MANRRPYAMILQPGFKAYETGVSHAWMAGQYLGSPPTTAENTPVLKKRKLMAPMRQPRYAKSNTSSNSRYGKRKSVKSDVKKTILQMAVPYHNALADATAGKANIEHNTIYSLNLTAFLTQGTGNDDRQGDQVFLEALKLRGFVRSNATANSYTYRILVGFSPKEFNFVSQSNTGLQYVNLFLPGTGGTSFVNGIINPKAFTCVYDNTVDINSLLSAVTDISSMSATIPLKKKFAYQSDASTLGKTNNLYLVLIGYVTGGVTGTTGTGDIQIATDLIFKNL